MCSLAAECSRAIYLVRVCVFDFENEQKEKAESDSALWIIIILRVKWNDRCWTVQSDIFIHIWRLFQPDIFSSVPPIRGCIFFCLVIMFCNYQDLFMLNAQIVYLKTVARNVITLVSYIMKSACTHFVDAKKT